MEELSRGNQMSSQEGKSHLESWTTTTIEALAMQGRGRGSEPLKWRSHRG